MGERKDIDDGKIEVINYVTNYSFSGINIGDRIEPFSVNLNKEELEISDTSFRTIKVNEFSSDSIIRQFIKDAPYHSSGYISSFHGRIMYIKIPKSLRIDANSSKTLQMIN